MPFLLYQRKIGSLTPTYIVSADKASANEGESFIVSLSTTNVNNGANVGYTITGVTSPDVNNAPLTGNFVVGTVDSVEFDVTADKSTEGTETFTITLDGPFSSTTQLLSTLSANVTINDTSLTANYDLQSTSLSVDEGDSFTITLITENVANGQNIPYTITGVSSADIDGAPLTGNFVKGTTEQITFTVTADQATEGTETFFMQLDNVPTCNISVTINDTSNAYSFSQTFAAPASNWDFVNAARTAGWPGTQDINATITVNPGVTVYSTTAGPTGYAMRIAPAPATYPTQTIPAGSTINLVNQGTIVGKAGTGGAGGAASITPNPIGPTYYGVSSSPGSAGSAGGTGLRVASPVTIDNTGGVIAGGGGGGGGGGGSAIVYSFAATGAASGGSGGGGGGGSGPGQSPSPGGNAGPGTNTSVPGIGTVGPGNAGNAGTTTGGALRPGVPRTWAPLTVTATGGAGAAGGGRGSTGGTGGTGSATSPSPTSPRSISPGASGGAAGSAISGNPFVTLPGPQTGTINGPRV